MRIERDLAFAQAKDISRQFNEEAMKVSTLTKYVSVLEERVATLENEIRQCPNCSR